MINQIFNPFSSRVNKSETPHTLISDN